MNLTESGQIPLEYPSILLFLKAPIPGEVKTRLARTIGNDAACAAYETLVKRQLSAIPPTFPLEIHYEGKPYNSIKEWIERIGSELEPRASLRYRPQARGDLGQRLSCAFDQTLAEHPHRAGAIAIGGDCPYLEPTHFFCAASALTKQQVVIGPATDGGYYLIGLPAPNRALFDGMKWGTNQLLEQTYAVLRKNQCAYEVLETLEDVDDADSWNRWLES